MRSNRTFMELKLKSTMIFIVTMYGSNRTFMELKLIRNKRVESHNLF